MLRVCTSGKTTSCQHTSDQVMDYESTDSKVKDEVEKIDQKLAALCDAEKTSLDDCNGKLDKDLLRNLKVPSTYMNQLLLPI